MVAWCRCKCSGAQATAKPNQKVEEPTKRPYNGPVQAAGSRQVVPVSRCCEVMVLLVLSTGVLCPGPGEGPVHWAGLAGACWLRHPEGKVLG